MAISDHKIIKANISYATLKNMQKKKNINQDLLLSATWAIEKGITLNNSDPQKKWK